MLRTGLHGAYFVLNSSLILGGALYLLPEIFNASSTFFNQLSLPIQFLALLLILDFFSYGLHILSHRILFLWRFHQVHHSDDTLDASTGLRMHIVQILFSLLPELLVLYLLRPSPHAYFAFVIFSQAIILLHHAKVQLPNSVISFFSPILVLRPFHERHHEKELSPFRNFGSVLSFWDRLFSTSCHKNASASGLSGVRNPFTLEELFLPKIRRIN